MKQIIYTELGTFRDVLKALADGKNVESSIRDRDHWMRIVIEHPGRQRLSICFESYKYRFSEKHDPVQTDRKLMCSTKDTLTWGVGK